MRAYLAELDAYDDDGPLNLVTSDDISAWTSSGTPVVTAGISDPFGGTAAYRLADDNGAAVETKSRNVAFTGNGVKYAVFVVREATMATSGAQQLYMWDSSLSQPRLDIVIIGYASGNPTIVMNTGKLLGEVYAGNGYRALFVETASITAGSTNIIYLYPASTSAATGAIDIYRINVFNTVESVERFLAQAIVNAGEYARVHTRRYANVPYTSGPTDPTPNARFLPRILRAPTVALNMYAPGRSGGSAEVSLGELTLANPDGALNALLADHTDGRSFRGYVGEADDLRSLAFPTDFTLVDEAIMLDPTSAGGEVQVRLRDARRSLDVPLQPNKYAGDADTYSPAGEHLEGDATLKDKPKPWAFGKVTNVTPVCVNEAKHIYQLRDGAVQAVNEVQDAGVGIGGTPFEWGEHPLDVPFGSLSEIVWWEEQQKFVGVGFAEICAASSEDGRTWVSHYVTDPYAPSASVTFRGLAFGGGLWVIVGDRTSTSGLTFTSPDLAVWTQRTTNHTGSTDINRDVAHSPSLARWVVVADGGKVETSDDYGATWTSRTYPHAGGIYCIVWSPELSLFVAGGASGQVATSSDGITWTSRTYPHATDCYDVAWSPELGLFCMVGKTGKVATSSDGITWTSRTWVSSTNVNNVIWTKNGWVTSGNSKTATSPDGITWTERTHPGAPTTCQGLAYGASTLVWVGTVGTCRTTSMINRAYASEAELLDDDLEPILGTVGTYEAGGLFRLGSEPAGQLTVDFTVGATAGDRTLGKLCEALCAVAGLVADVDYDASDLDDLDTLTGDAVVGLFVDGETSLRPLLDFALGGQGCWYAGDALGVLHFGRLDAPEDESPVALTIEEWELRAPLDIMPTSDPNDAVPSWRINVRHSQNYSPQAAYWTPEWQQETSADATVQAAHPLARQSTIDSALTTSAAAATEAGRVRAMRGERRRTYQTAVTDTAARRAALVVGAVVNVVTTAYGFDAGKALTVLGLRFDRETEIISLTLWG